MPLRTQVLVASVFGASVLAVASLEAASVFAVMMAVAVTTVGAHHPFARFGPANYVTMLRAAIVALAATLLLEPPSERLAWFVVGATACLAALDGLDGWLARRTGLASDFGAQFDVEVDALLILVLSLFVWRHDKAGVWVLACGLMRYAFVAAGWVSPWMNGPLKPTLRGKSVAVGQFAGLSLALAPVVPAPVSTVVAAITLATLVWSFALDVTRLWWRDGG
ncbi:MAG: CDP-alcohol phosphatidyltransferase family protein [Acidobacteriota bacterium]|nr:CDP-alcohol phosphatidyltransferase family protein [Acidobacteriota bacterium]